MDKMTLIAVDVESSGLDPVKNAILSLCLVRLDDEFNSIDLKEILILPENKDIESSAMIFNNINLEEHKKVAKSRHLAQYEMISIIELWSKGDKVAFLGHGVSFDISFMKSLNEYDNLSDRMWNTLVGHRHIDTHSILLFLRDCGLYGGGMKLKEAVECFSVKVFGEYHTSRTDALAVAYLYKKLVNTTEHLLNCRCL